MKAIPRFSRRLASLNPEEMKKTPEPIEVALESQNHVSPMNRRLGIIGPVFVFLFGLWVMLLQGCGSRPTATWETFQGKTMGTSFTIKYLRPEQISKPEVEKSIAFLLKDFDDLMSNWNPKSWVTGFNQKQTTEWNKVHPYVLEILEVSKDIYNVSDGAFDVTISPLIEWWGFGSGNAQRSKGDGGRPDFKTRIGMDKLEWRREDVHLRKKHPQLEINCSAVAKGFGVDLVAKDLINHGVRNFMVEIGGEVRVAGKPEGRENWSLGIRRPDSQGQPIFAVVKMPEGTSLATSGDYFNAFRENGKRFSHILDPRLGKPVDHRLTSVTILGRDCAEVDAVATACMVLGEREGLRLVEKLEGFEAYFITRETDGYHTSSTKGFPSFSQP